MTRLSRTTAPHIKWRAYSTPMLCYHLVVLVASLSCTSSEPPRFRIRGTSPVSWKPGSSHAVPVAPKPSQLFPRAFYDFIVPTLYCRFVIVSVIFCTSYFQWHNVIRCLYDGLMVCCPTVGVTTLLLFGIRAFFVTNPEEKFCCGYLMSKKSI